MENRAYALEERIGDPSLFCGREREMNLLLNWASAIPRLISKSRALLGRRKSGKTAIMQRLFNILWNRNGRVIPFYFEVLDQDQWLLDFCDKYYRTFLTQYISFKDRTPLDKKNKPRKWNDLNETVRLLGNENILRETENFQEDIEKEAVHNAMMAAFSAPAEYSGYDDVFFVVMIDEIQYMTKYIFYDRERKIREHNLPGAFHGLVELKYAPMLVSGSYIGWMTQMMQEMFVGGRLKRTPVSPKLTFSEGMEAVFRYAEYHDIPVTERIALVINTLAQSDPFYISVLFGSDCPGKDFSTSDGVIHTLTYEMKDRGGELFGTWSEYIDSTLNQVNDIYGKKVLLYLSKERYKECTRTEIREHIGWPPEKDRELEKKLRTLEYGGLVTRSSSDFHYQGIPDDILDLIFRERYQYEIENVTPDMSDELAGKIKTLEQDKKSLAGMLNELKGRMLELAVWRELNRCRKEKKVIKNFAGRMRKISEGSQADKMRELAELCGKSRFRTVWMNYYIQLPDTPLFEVDVLAQGEDGEACWALVFETKNRQAENPPTIDEARIFAEKAGRINQLLAQKGKKIRFVCPVYFSAKGFEKEVETWLHSKGILTADMETWDR